MIFAKLTLLRLSSAFFAIIFLISLQATGRDAHKPLSLKDRHFLVNLFKAEGFEKHFLLTTFNDRRLVKLPIVISKNVHNKENKRNYDDFYSAYSLRAATRFSKKWQTVLMRASEKFEVDREVLVAILLVETGLGNVLGRYPIITVFSSILLEHREKQITYKDSQPVAPEEQYVVERLQLKSKWAKKELLALLSIIVKNKHSAFRLKGSFAGAFGIPQFLPSSYLRWGYDSDQNGTVNLFLFPDAIYSTANYLRAHGWKKGLYLESNKDVIYMYNRSHIYVETVLNVAKKIQAHQKAKVEKEIEQTNLVQDYNRQHEESSS